MKKNETQQSLDRLEHAVTRLKEALAEKETSLTIDGTIQRFEFVFELCWKTLQRALLEEGLDAKTPREMVTKAYQSGWVENEKLWLQMLKNRNETSHTYNEDLAEKIYNRIPGYYKEFEKILRFLEKKSQI